MGKGRDTDLSESALAHATKKIEVEEVDFTVEINGLMRYGKRASADKVPLEPYGGRRIGTIPVVDSTGHPLG